MKILVIGASSYVGARIYLDLSKKHGVTGTYSVTKLSEKFIHLDITDPEEVNKVIMETKPEVIIHCANNANARWCEANPEEAQKLNVESTKYIVDAANQINAKLIYISSFAALNLNNVYGRTKWESEGLTKNAKGGWIILRPSYIVGFSPNTANDRPFNRLLKNLDEGVRAEYDISWKFQTTWVGHLSEVIEGCLEKKLSGELIPVATPELKSRFDVGHDILSPFGVKVFPVDKKDALSVTRDDLAKIKELGLPGYSYQEIIAKIISEIKQRELFRI